MKEEIKGELVTLTPALPQEFTEKSLIAVFNQVAAEVRCEVPDIETQTGRKAVKDLAAKVSKTKKAIDTPLRDYLRELKTLPKIVEKNARESLERFESLQAEILQPLELARAEQDKNLEILQLMVNSAASSTIEDLQADLVILDGIDLDLFWPELVKKAKLAKETAETTVKINLDRLIKEAEQQAELDRLKKEKEEADRKLLKEKIEREAQEKAQKDALQALANAERAKQEAERKAEMQAEKAREDAIRQSEIAEQQAKQREAQAAEAERKRIADDEAKKAAADKAREQDIAHRTSINRETLAEMISQGINEDTAKKVITMIAKGQLRHVKIHY